MVGAERKAGGLHHVPGYGGQGGVDVNSEVQGVGPGPVEGKGEGGSWPLLPSCCQSLLLKRPSYDEKSKVQGSHVPMVVASAACGGGQTLPGTQGSPPPRAAFSRLCLESAQGEFVTDAGPLFTATPPQHRLPPPPRTLDSPCSAFILTVEDHFIDSGKREKGVF